MRTLAGHTGFVWSVDFSPDGTRVVSGSHDNLVKIWNTETGAKVSSHAFTWWSVGLDWVSRGGKPAVSGVGRVLNLGCFAGAPADGARGHASQVI
jgi:WD40 repeat protein